MIKVKLTPREMVFSPETVARHREDLEAMNRIGLMAREDQMAYRNSGGLSWDRQLFLRRLLETLDPNSRDAAIVRRKLGVDAKNEGGEVEAPVPFHQDPRLGQLGQSLVAIGQRDFKGASEALTPKATDKPKVDKQAEEEARANKMVVQLATEAKSYTAAAAEAGDFIHGFVTPELTEEEQGLLDSALDAAGGLLDTLVEGAKTVAGAFSQTARVREEALMKIAAAKYPDSYVAFTKLQAVGENLALAYLPKLGPGPKTDTDLRVAREAVFNIRAPAATWNPQLNATIARINGAPVADPVEASEPNEKVPEGTPPAPEVTEESKMSAEKDYGPMSRIHGSTSGGTGETETLVDKTKDAVDDAADTVKSWFS